MLDQKREWFRDRAFLRGSLNVECVAPLRSAVLRRLNNWAEEKSCIEKCCARLALALRIPASKVEFHRSPFAKISLQHQAACNYCSLELRLWAKQLSFTTSLSGYRCELISKLYCTTLIDCMRCLKTSLTRIGKVFIPEVPLSWLVLGEKLQLVVTFAMWFAFNVFEATFTRVP